MIQHIIRSPRGYAARLHTNVCGRQVTWTRDDDASRFTSIAAAFEAARLHGLKDFEFHVEPAPDREDAA